MVEVGVNDNGMDYDGIAQVDENGMIMQKPS
jgi:hypothetical protein